MGELMKKNKAMEARRKRRCTLGSFLFYNGRRAKIWNQANRHPCWRFLSNANRHPHWRFALHPWRDFTKLCHGLSCCVPRPAPLSPWNSSVWLAVPYVDETLRMSPFEVGSWSLHARIASVNGDLLTDTKLASGSGGLGPACMHFTYKIALSRKLFKNKPIWKNSL